MKKENIIAAILEYFQENDEIFVACIEELDSYNGYLGDDRYYQMDDISEIYHDADPIELLQRAFFGHDEDSWTTDGSGNREYSPFNPNREYFTFNGYGNLVSSNWKDYSGHLDKYAVESMRDHRRYIDTIDQENDLAELFDQLEEAED